MILAAVVALLLALVHIAAGDSLGPLGPFVKMGPVAILGGLVLRAPATPARRLAGFGLLVGALADAAIMFSFLGGLAVFLAAHLLYIAAFVRVDARLRLARLVPVLVWATVALPPLVAGAGPLRVPVLAYGIVIFTMIWRAAAAWGSAGWNAGTIGLLGAVLFGLSDTLLGYTRFVQPLPASSLLVMGTYWGGQALIATSFLKHK
ncbi:MAG: lysoplasmalogenase [Vicinamibacteria bacterium]|nr:lysoplasmalogenase [Vicinamibacteria bacterium]